LRLFAAIQPLQSPSSQRIWRVAFHPSIARAFRLLDAMPEISRFLGVVISMYFDEHNPPHFHVRYNESRAVVSIKECSILDGSLPPRVRGLVTEWAELHQEELLQMWESKEFHKIEPLA
jgi:hypothetical protein